MSIGYVETPEQEVLRLREQNRQWLAESTKLLAELEQLRKENERLRNVVLAEREACAKVCEEGLPLGMSHTTVARLCAAAIRTREEINAT